MRRTRLSDVTAVTDVSDGGDLEGMSFLPLAPATRLPDAAAVTSAPAVSGAALLPGIGSMTVVAPALPAAAAASVHSVESPVQNAAANAVGPAGATPDQVRQALNATNLNVTGAGVTVGVLSDSFNALGGAAADYGGALPPASQVVVLQDRPGGTDEGRAMMQIVHDVAPGANLDFHTANPTEQDFANGILALANAGCRVICDDVIYFHEPFYQTGVVAKAVQTVEQQGVIFLTSAGNSDARGYQAAWNPIQMATVGRTVLRNTQNFGNGSPTQTVTIAGNPMDRAVNFVVQWNQPYGKVTSDLEVVVFVNNNVFLQRTRHNNIPSQQNDPFIRFLLPRGSTYTIAIQNLAGPDPGLIKEAAIGSAGLVTIQGENSGTTQGHQISPYALAEGAVDSKNTPNLSGTLQSENFSSTGAGTQLWFNNDGSAIPGGPLVYNPLAVSGIDNIATTVNPPPPLTSFAPFFGTSAAAPSVAGVVADMLQANPNLTFARVKQILQQTALPFGDQNIAGAGLVNAAAAVQLALQTATFATTANLVLRTNALDPAGLNQTLNQSLYRMYNVGSNALLAAAQLGRVGSDWGFVTLGGFFDGDTADMLLRNSASGAFQVYNVAPNNNIITNSASLGAVGLDFQTLGFGNFGSFGNTDMMLRNVNTGALQVYNISNNQITNSASMGTVGLDWQFSGVGNFSSRGTSDMLLRNSNTGGLQVYDINSNAITNSFFIGNVGLDYEFSGVGNFSSVPGESDLLLRNRSTGALQVYNIANNQLTGSFSLGAVGTDWKFAGVAPVSAPGASDLVLRNFNTGAFQAYNIAGNTLVGSASLGAPGPDWQLGGFAASTPAGSIGSSGAPLNSSSEPAAMNGSTTQTGTSTFQLADANGNAVGSPVDSSSFSSSMINPAPPDATTANMVLRNASNSAATYEIYNLGVNSILAGYPLAQVGSDWGFVTLGNFNSSDPSDMLLRNSASGTFLVYDIIDNNIISSTSLGTVGVEWQPMGFGTFGAFSMLGETDMILRDVNTGDLQVYQIDNNEITASAFLGTIGLEWQFSGIGNWGSSGTSDLLVRNSNTGDLEVHNISDNQIYDSAFLGTVGLEWQFSGVGNFSGVPGESDLLLRNSNTGELRVYNISNNEITGSESLGKVGLDWQFAGVAPVSDPGASDLVLRNVNTGTFQVYNIANNHLTGSTPLGAVGVEWQLGGFAPTISLPPDFTQPEGLAGSTSQLVQAMAGFGGGAADTSNTVPLGADTSQQTFLTTPHA
jgi:Subtilase family